MNQNYDRHTIEQLKLQLQTTIQNVLTNTQPDTDDAMIISRAMAYIVTSHNSFEEQYYRIKEYQFALNALHKKYIHTKPAETPFIAVRTTPMFSEKESPF